MSIIDSVFRTFQSSRNQYEVTIDQVKQELGNMIDKIVLYGAGSAGIAFLMYLRDAGICPQYFSDGNENRWNTVCEGIKIIPPQRITELVGKDALIIITINTDGQNYCKSFPERLRKGGPHAVFQKLYQCGCKNVIEYTFFRHCFELFRYDKYNLPSCSDISEIERHEKEIKQVFEYMADDISRETFLDILRFRLIDDTIQIRTYEQEKEYFDYELYTPINNEIFIDCGAYIGTTFKIFFNNNENFEKYYAIEPDHINYQKLLQYCESLDISISDKVITKECAVYNSSNERIRFYSLYSPGSFVCEDGPDFVSTIRIDDLLNGNKVTFIKMNIEGSEIKALEGAKKTIKQYQPVLAIMGYHKTSDFWIIPQIIKQMVPEYTIFLRSYMNHISFMYYAVPRERMRKKGENESRDRKNN